MKISSNKNIKSGLAFIWKCGNTSNGSKNGLESNWSFDSWPLKLEEKKVERTLIRTCHMGLKFCWQKL